jgi:hypothetical protein
MRAREQAGATELLSIDTNIEAVAHEALEEAASSGGKIPQ